MIKFFRKIRQNLLSEGKIGKYMKYAIGEVILVVIGILIALQINTWNEHRKLQNEEMNLLLEVKSNLEVTLNNFKNDTKFNIQSINQMRKIEQYIAEDLGYSEELDISFGRFGVWYSPYPILTAYTTLKTKGLDIISNIPLRNKIVNMYEYEFIVLRNDYDKAEWNLSNAFSSFFYKHVRSKNSKQSARPNDFESLKLNVEFRNKLGRIIGIRESGLEMYKTTMVNIEDLIDHLDKELISRK